jgi:hypothetical protein
VPTFPHTAADVRELARRERDLYWHPQRYAPVGGREKAELIAAEPTGRAERRRRFRDLRAATERLRPFVRDRLAETGRRLTRARQEADANAALRRRDFAWVLYPEDVLRGFLEPFSREPSALG